MAVGLAVGTSGCAAMFNGTKETISVDSKEDAEIYVDGKFAGEGHARSTVPKKGPVTITAKKEGCQPHSVQVERKFDATTLLGFFIDAGLFSILLIDGAATGAWSKAAQTHYTLSPRCDEAE
jgi:hypothetical protein